MYRYMLAAPQSFCWEALPPPSPTQPTALPLRLTMAGGQTKGTLEVKVPLPPLCSGRATPESADVDGLGWAPRSSPSKPPPPLAGCLYLTHPGRPLQYRGQSSLSLVPQIFSQTLNPHCPPYFLPLRPQIHLFILSHTHVSRSPQKRQLRSSSFRLPSAFVLSNLLHLVSSASIAGQLPAFVASNPVSLRRACSGLVRATVCAAAASNKAAQLSPSYCRLPELVFGQSICFRTNR